MKIISMQVGPIMTNCYILIDEESKKTAGIGAELAALFQEELYDELDGPVTRIAALDVPVAYNIAMEHYSIPDAARICTAIRGML